MHWERLGFSEHVSRASHCLLIITGCGCTAQSDGTHLMRLSGRRGTLQPFNPLQSCTLVQFDLVRDVMHFYANLSLPRDTSSDRKRAAIEDMLEMMELQHCYGWKSKMHPPGGANRHAVGNLTDSEQWRLMVAVNLLTGPTCLLLDEPTTGPLVSAALSHMCVAPLSSLSPNLS
jgi:ABC-type branched-subunit amino acid transport system ATPase component